MNDDKDTQVLEEIHNKLSQRIEGIHATIDCHLDDNDINVDISFLRKLYAEARGLREAQEIVCDKLKELTKEEENVAQEK